MQHWCRTFLVATRCRKQAAYLRHRATFATHASDWLRTARDVLAWCRAIMEAIAEPKRARTRGDTWHPGAPAKTFRTAVSQIRYLRQACLENQACLRHQPQDSAGVPGYPLISWSTGPFWLHDVFNGSPTPRLHHAETLLVLCFADPERVRQPRRGVANKGCSRHRFDRLAGAPERQIPPRVVARFGSAIASMMALHHANKSLAVRSQSEACVANVARCRKGLFATPCRE